MIAQLFNGQSKTITSAAVVIGASSLASRFLGVIRDRLLVEHFTVGPTLDAYYAAFQIPNLLFNFLVLGTLSVAVLPVLMDLLNARDRYQANRLLSSVFTWAAIIMGIMCLAIAIFARPLMQIVGPGFNDETLEVSIRLTRIMVLSPLFFSLSSVLSTALNATKRFVVVSVAPLLYNCCIILGIVVFSRFLGIYGVAVGVVLGALVHMSIQWPAVRHVGFYIRPHTDPNNPHLRNVLKLFLPRVIGIDVSQVSLFVGSIAGSMLASGSVALYNLANNIQSVPIGIFAIPFAVAAFPSFSSAIAEDNKERFIGLFSHTVRQIIFFLVPLTFFTLVLRAHIIRLIIGTRELSWDDTRMASAMLAIFAVGFIFQGIAPVLSRAFYATKNTVVPVVVSVYSMIVNVLAVVGLSVLFSHSVFVTDVINRVLRLDGISDIRALALPMAFTLAVTMHCNVLWWMLSCRLGSMDERGIERALTKILFASFLSSLAIKGTLALMVPLNLLHTFLGVLGQFIVAGIVGAATYIMLALLMKSPEMWAFLSTLHRQMLKITGPVAVQEVEDL